MAQAATAERIDQQGVMSPPGSAEVVRLRQHLDQRMGGLLVDRMSWWLHWREIADYLIPRRYLWLVTPNKANRGSPINQRIIDNTGTVALRVLAAGMMAGITSPGRPWFRLTLDDQDLAAFPSVKAWLDEVASRMRTVFAESNFYTSLGTLYEDLGAFGTGAMIMYEDFDDVIRCYNSCAGEYFLANSPRMAIDTFYRQFTMTAAQVYAKFGKSAVSENIRSAVQTRGAALSRESTIAHAIEPNDDQLVGAPAVKGKAFREVYWEWGQAQSLVLQVRGFHENPVIAPRWSIVGNDAYGRSPGMDALGDIKQLQVEQKRKAQAIDKMVNPPMVASIELKNEPASLLPGGMTYVANLGSDRPGFKPVYEVDPKIRELMEDIGEVQGRVKDTFFYNLFLMISQLETVRSATEIDARREEKLIQLGPVLERFENEALDPAIERTFNIMLRAGLLPPVPKELQGQHVRTEYISMLAQAQKAATTTSMERVATMVGRISAVVPDALDKIDFDEFIDQYADGLQVTPKIIRSDDAVAQIRKGRAKQQQAQQAMATAGAAADGAKTLSETDVGGGRSALSMMLGLDAGEPQGAAA